jgi:hypothetical protein
MNWWNNNKTKNMIKRCRVDYFKDFQYTVIAMLCVLLISSCADKSTPDFTQAEEKAIYASIPLGRYSNETKLALHHNFGAGSIHYTTNGNNPNAESSIFNKETPLSELVADNWLALQIMEGNPAQNTAEASPQRILNFLPNAVSIKAAVFDVLGNRLSDYFVFDYVLENHEELPVCMINVAPESLLDRDTGIFVAGVHFDEMNRLWTGNYYQKGRAWERTAHVSFLVPGDSGLFQQWIGLRAHGGNSRRFEQKGMRIIARKKFEEDRIKKQLFTHNSEIKRFTLKPFQASWSGYGFENLLGYRLARNLDVDHLEIHPVVVYINGVYWGIYLLEERMDKQYFKRLSGEEKVRYDWARSDRILEIANSLEKSLDFDHFKSTLKEIDDENYAELDQLIDINSYIDYQILQQFISNFDWPANNNKRWRELGGKWRWIYFDGDAAFGDPFYNSMYHAIGVYNERFYSVDENTTVLFRKLCAYPPFYERFEARMNELLQTTLSSQFVQAEMDSIVIPESEILRQVYRFAYPESIRAWHKAAENVKSFVALRPEAMKSFYADIEATLSSLQSQE